MTQNELSEVISIPIIIKTNIQDKDSIIQVSNITNNKAIKIIRILEVSTIKMLTKFSRNS